MAMVLNLLFCCSIFLASFVIVLSLPQHGYQLYLGHDYWNNRHKLNYPSDWPGFWNYAANGRKEYKRASSEVTGLACHGGCTCSDVTEELKCSGAPNNLFVKNRRVRVVMNKQLPKSLVKIKIWRSGLMDIENEAFHNLTALKTLNLAMNKLKSFPDLSTNSALEKLDLYSNNIRLWSHNVTALPRSLVRVILIKNAIDWIPDNWFNLPNLQYLALSENKLKRFPGPSFTGCKSLRFISADQNKIETITYPSLQPLFGNDSQLVHLNLSNNKIRSISSGSFQDLIHLKVLEIHNNELEVIGDKVFYSIPELLHLDLRGNKLESITAEGFSAPFQDLPNLKVLILMMQKRPAKHVMYNAFKNLPALEDLWLNNNKLANFPHPALSHEPRLSLRFLHLENNEITSLSSFAGSDFPPELQVLHTGLQITHKPFSKTPQLERLFVHVNHISDVHEETLWELGKLQEIYLSSNRLTNGTIHPEALRNLTRLSIVHLDHNKFHYVPYMTLEKYRMPAVRELNLVGNRVTYILRGTFSHLDTLRELNLDSNAIVTIENSAFPVNIERIYLENNKFVFKHENQFSNLTKLLHLDLSHNFIDIVPETAFHGLTQLTYLDLTKNRLGRIMKVLFQDLSNLVNLQLDDNEIAFIEDGSFAAIRKFSELLLRRNHLVSLPNGGDFHNKEIRRFDVSNNRITSIRQGTFVNVTCVNSWCQPDNSNRGSIWDFTGNQIVSIDTGAFQDFDGSACTLQFGGDKTGLNVLKEIRPRAFQNVKACYINLKYLELQDIAAETFKDVYTSKDIELQRNKISRIENNAFLRVDTKNLNLDFNKIQAITSKMFGDNGSTIRDTLNLGDNKIQVLHEDSFKGVMVTRRIQISRNRLILFPYKALRNQDPRILDMRYNQIPSITVGWLDHLKTLQRLYLAHNNMTVLGANLFRKQVWLDLLDLSRNHIDTVEEGAFNNLQDLDWLYLQNNRIAFLPAFSNQSLLPIRTLNLRDNVIQNLGQDCFDQLKKLNLLDFGGTNKLSCDCNVYNSLVSVIKSLTPAGRAAVCRSPLRVNGAKFFHGGNYEDIYKQEFTCSPVSVQASAPADYQLKVTWKKPGELHPYVNITQNNTYINTWSSTHVLNITYSVTCNSSDAPTLKATTTQRIMVFTRAHGVKAGTDYTCHVTMTVRAHNGTSLDGGVPGVILDRTTPRSEEASMTTLEGKAPVANKTENATNFYLDVTFYDFKTSEEDFVGLKDRYRLKYKNPQYINSPYGSWLAISNNPTRDSFSDWFRSEALRNQHYEEVVELKKQHETDSNGNALFTLYQDKFFPVDGRGWGAEGQRDCYTNALRNYGFTAAVRSTFNFSGLENFAFAGGEELWVYINKQLVVQIFHDPRTSAVPCRTLQLSGATKQGGGVIIPQQGSMAGRKCQETGAAHSEQINMTLVEGLPYSVDLFVAERFKCDSMLLYQASGVQFVRQLDSTLPVDYVLNVTENLHTGGLVQEFLVADAFSSGPYSVEILRGNEQRRFEVKAASYVDYPGAPGTPAPPSVVLDGETVFLCPNVTNHTVQPIPTVAPAIEKFVVSTSEAKLILKSPLDYEHTTSYLIRMRVTDTGNPAKPQGNVTVQLFVVDFNDLCPILPDVDYHLKPLPPLQGAASFVVKATDGDSGVNAEIEYKTSEVVEAIPKIESTKYYVLNGSQVVWSNKTIEWTYKYYVFAVDGGSPKRGDRIPLTITFNATCKETAKIVVNGTSGHVFFRAPKMTVSEYPRNSSIKPMCRRCGTGYYCAGDGSEKPCGVTSPTEYSFGGAETCSECPEGWLCHNGTALPCPRNTYVKCNRTWCPDKCFPCEAGTVCYEGRRYECSAGTYSDGTGYPCKLCPPGSFNNVSRSESCHCCPAGYSSTYMKTSCRPCPYNEWADQGGFPNCSLCRTCFSDASCPCMRKPCFPGVDCRNAGTGKFKCESCPSGYEGDGENCIDVDECTQARPCYGACVNLSPGYRCTACPAGYRGNAPSGVGLAHAQKYKQTCTEIDECVEGSDACDSNAKCINTLGSYKCGPCNPGFIGDGYAGCYPGDLCTNGSHTCHANASCTNTGTGTYKCRCKYGYGGNGEDCELDSDLDAIPSKGLSCDEANCRKDNCPSVPNTGQEDNDGDTDGDSCDDDDDNDLIPDKQDNCPFVKNLDQPDSDGDGVGDACDNCVNKKNKEQTDTDGDGQGDECDNDKDGDVILNANDKCPTLNVTGDQKDTDGDGVGDICDNCPSEKNAGQSDATQSGYGDVCSGLGKDTDGDGVLNFSDNCPDLPNGEQADADDDNIGDPCDDDQDNDGVPNIRDNCPLARNPGQEHEKLHYDVRGNPVGDSCVNDFDKDGVKDIHDACSRVQHISKTSFLEYFTVDLHPGHTDPVPEWKVAKKGVDVEHVSNTSHPGMLIGRTRYGPVDYSGTLYVKGKDGSDYIGVVFGYQSNRKFYVVMWRRENLNYADSNSNAGIKGLQLKLVNSKTGPHVRLAEALWHSGDTSNQVTLLWQDPKMAGWQHETSYSFHVTHRPSIGLIRVHIKRGEAVLTDSGDIYDITLTGGRLGMIAFGQQDVIWSRLEAKCSDRVNTALLFDGENDHVVLPSIQTLGLTDSFTISAWVNMAADYPMTSMPIVCSLDATLCLYLKNRRVHGILGSDNVEGREGLEADTWQHVALRFDAQRHELELFVNGSSVGKSSDVTPYKWQPSALLYIGTDGQHYLNGTLDDVTLWGVRVPDDEIGHFLKLAGLTWPIHKGLVQAHYNMEEIHGTLLTDRSGNHHHGNLMGGPIVIPSSVDKNRFVITFPNNRRKRWAIWPERHSEL